MTISNWLSLVELLLASCYYFLYLVCACTSVLQGYSFMEIIKRTTRTHTFCLSPSDSLSFSLTHRHTHAHTNTHSPDASCCPMKASRFIGSICCVYGQTTSLHLSLFLGLCLCHGPSSLDILYSFLPPNPLFPRSSFLLHNFKHPHTKHIVR